MMLGRPDGSRSFGGSSAVPVVQHAVWWGLVTAIAGVLFFYRFDERALWSSHEGRAGQHAQLMLDIGRWGMPTLYYGESDYQKPPLYYWLVAVTAWCRGTSVDAWCIRFPAAASAMLGVWLVYALGARLWQPRAGFLAALILATTMRYVWLARVGRIDMPLSLATTCVLGCFWMAYRAIAAKQSATVPEMRDERLQMDDGFGHDFRDSAARLDSRAGRALAWPWLLAAYMAVAVAIMLKGPVGFVLPMVSIALFLLVERQPVWPWQYGFGRLMGQLGLGWGLPLIALLAAPWFIWAQMTTEGEFFRAFFLHHHFDRTFGVEGLKPEPIWYYVPRLFVDAFPWSLLIPGAFVAVVRSGDEVSKGDRFALCWVAGMFAFLSVVRFKRHDYLLPLLPGVALALAGYFEQLRGRPGVWRLARTMSWAVTGAAMAAAAIALLLRHDWPADHSFVRAVESLDDAEQLVIEQWRELVRGAPVGAWSSLFMILAVSIAGVIAVRMRRIEVATCLVAAANSVAFLLYVGLVLPALEPIREQRTLAEVARELRPTGTELFYYGREDQQLMFYLGPGSRWLPNRHALRPVITRPEPVFVIMELERFLTRQQEWLDVQIVPLARNVDNRFGRHSNPAILVTNAAGWRLVQARGHGSAAAMAN